MLSPKQKKIMEFVGSYGKKHGYSPSLEEIRKHFRLASVSTAHHHVKRLKEGGYLEKESNRARGITLSPLHFGTPFSSPDAGRFIALPILGSASCGPAELLAEENIDGYLKVSATLAEGRDGIFVLRAQGDSMNEADIDGKNIEEGDFVLIDSLYRTPKDGEYVLSVIDGYANLKRFERRPKTGEVVLISESSNPKHKPIFVSSYDDFMINGRIIAVIKK